MTETVQSIGDLGDEAIANNVARRERSQAAARALLDIVQGDDADEKFRAAFYYLHFAADALSQEMSRAEEGTVVSLRGILQLIADDYGALNLMRWAREIARDGGDRR